MKYTTCEQENKYLIQSNLSKATTQHGCFRTVVVANKNQQQGASSEKRSQHMYFLEDNLLHAISKLHISIVTCCHCKFSLHAGGIAHTVNKDHIMCQVFPYKKVKNNGSNKCWAKPWSRSLMRGAHSREVLIAGISMGKFQCFGQVVVYGRWSHMNCITVYFYN